MAYSVEREAIAWLAGLGYDAHFAVPGKRPDRFVTVSRVSGSVANRVDHPQVAIDIWAQSAEEASDAALAIREAALGGSRPSGVRSLEGVTGPVWAPDPETRQPCYELLLDMACRI